MQSGSASVAIIGGGPAGLIAAEVLASSGCSVTVFDHKPSVGRKFLLAGRGGLNLTHSEPLDRFLDRYTVEQPILTEAIAAFPPNELRLWCDELGEATFTGSSGRVFPKSFRATPLLRAWLIRLADQGVSFELRQRWLGWVPDGDHRSHRFTRAAIDTAETSDRSFDATVFALGGASWPRVGSDGGWVNAFETAGVAVTSLQPSNCGVRVGWSDVFRDRFAGTPIKNISVGTARGDVVVTDEGLEGGPVYANSAPVREQLANSPGSNLVLDLLPDLDHERLVHRLSKRRPKDSASTWLRSSGLSPVQIGLLREATGNSIPTDPETAATLIKKLPVAIDSLMPLDRAISSAGGVRFDEIDDSFQLQKLPGNFVAGEMLDWEAPTGGYLLQACFSTGVAAALGVLDFLDR